MRRVEIRHQISPMSGKRGGGGRLFLGEKSCQRGDIYGKFLLEFFLTVFYGYILQY
jgi:hypothetical protein